MLLCPYFLLCYNLPDKQENWVCVRKITITIMDEAGGVINNGSYPETKSLTLNLWGWVGWRCACVASTYFCRASVVLTFFPDVSPPSLV